MAAMGKAVWEVARRADLLYVNDYGLPAVLVNRWVDKPLVMKIVGDFAWEVAVRRNWTGDDIDSFQHGRYPRRIRALKSLRDYYVRRADQVIVPSQYLKKMVSGWGVHSDRIHVIYNALDSQLYTVDQYKAQGQTQRKGNGLTVLTVARLAPWKGVDALIKVIPRLPGQIRLLVVGEGPMRPALEAQAAHLGLTDQVQFVGAVPFDEIPYYLAISDIFVLFSGYEGFSHALLEACQAGLAVVASDRGGNPELIQHRQNGLLVSWPETEELAEALMELLSNADLRSRLGQAAQATVASFSWDRLLHQTQSVLEATAQNRRKLYVHSA